MSKAILEHQVQVLEFLHDAALGVDLNPYFVNLIEELQTIMLELPLVGLLADFHAKHFSLEAQGAWFDGNHLRSGKF